MISQVILAGLLATALVALLSQSLWRSVVYLAIFSLLSSFAFLLYQAPDVAIAEAVVGTGLSTVLFLVALKNRRLITIYYLQPGLEQINDQTITPLTRQMLKEIEAIYTDEEKAIQIIHTAIPCDVMLKNRHFDLLVVDDAQQTESHEY